MIHDQQKGIIPGNSSNNMRQIYTINSFSGSWTTSGQSLDDDQVLRRSKRDDRLTENLDESL